MVKVARPSNLRVADLAVKRVDCVRFIRKLIFWQALHVENGHKGVRWARDLLV